MMSTFPTVPSADSFFGNPFPAFEVGFPPWDSFHFPPPEEQPVLVDTPQPAQEPVNSHSGSENQPPSTPNSCSDEPNRNCSEETRRSSAHAIVDERKLRRMLSNRESARRSRMRKQRHLENLRNLVNRLRFVNRELMNRLRVITHQNQFVRRENDRLRPEAIMLRQKLWEIRQVLLVRQLQQQLNSSAWPCNNTTPEQFPHQSLITELFI